MILLSVLAVWRLTYMLSEEDGPYRLFYKLRMATFRWKWLNTSCFSCLSLWVALPFALYFSNDLPYLLFYILGLSGGAVMLYFASEKLL